VGVAASLGPDAAARGKTAAQIPHPVVFNPDLGNLAYAQWILAFRDSREIIAAREHDVPRPGHLA
jgi:hypothetical protein